MTNIPPQEVVMVDVVAAGSGATAKGQHRNLSQDADQLQLYFSESSTFDQQAGALEIGERVMNEAVTAGWDLKLDDFREWEDEDKVNFAQLIVLHARWANRVGHEDIAALRKTFKQIAKGTYEPSETNQGEQTT